MLNSLNVDCILSTLIPLNLLVRHLKNFRKLLLRHLDVLPAKFDPLADFFVVMYFQGSHGREL